MRSVSPRALVFVVSCLSSLLLVPVNGAQPPAPQQKPAQPTFRVRVDYVEVDAVVHDKAGRFVADLKKEDFEVFEDGKRQEVTNLQVVDVPVEPQPAPVVLAGRRFEPDVVSNAQAPGRVYLIVLDDLHISPTRSIAAQKLARKFIETNIAPNDLAAVVTTSGNRKASQEFTSNARLLFEAVDKLVGRKLMAPGMADLLAGGDPGSGSKVDENQRIFNARTTLDTLTTLTTLAGNIRSRRKAIVFVGEGIDYDLGKQDIISGPTSVDGSAGETAGSSSKDNGVPRRELRDRLRDFIAAANRGDVTLYALDPTVYSQQGDDFMDLGSAPPGDYDKYGQEIVRGARLQDDLIAAQDNLRTMAGETGGFAVTGSLKAAQNAFERIRNENSHYYILGYYPTNDRRDGKFRKIDVRVKRDGVNVTARKGYEAPKAGKAVQTEVIQTKEGTSPALREALTSVLPTTDLPISVVAAPFRGAGNGMASVLVMLQTPPGAVKFAEKAGRIEGKLELSFVAVDDQGKTRGGEHLDVDMPLKPETQAVVNRTGLLIQSRMSLPPGRYVLRVAARDAMTERVGSVHCDVEIPDYGKLPLSMSGLVISSERTTLANPRPDKDLPSVLPGSPAVVRTFVQGDALGVLAEIYDTKLATPHDIDIVTTVTGEDGREMYRHADKRSTSEMQGMQGGFGYLLKVPLSGMTAGTYMLRVEARSRLDEKNPAVRETMFVVKGPGQQSR